MGINWRWVATLTTMTACGSTPPTEPVQQRMEPPAAAAEPAPAAIPATPEEVDYGALHAERAAKVLVGARLAPVTLPLVGGGEVRLADIIGKRPIYLKFWATWCQPCLAQMPHLEASYVAHGGAIEVIAVNVWVNDTFARIEKVKRERSLTVPIAYDREGALARALHVTVTPQHVVVDRAGVIRHVGHHADATLDAALAAVLQPEGAAAGPASATAAPQVAGPPAPLTLSDGALLSFEQVSRGRVGITFMSTWGDWYLAESHPERARQAVEHAAALEVAKRAHPEITWVAVASPLWTGPSDVAEYLTRLKVSGAVGIDEDSTWFHRFGVREIPSTVLLEDGREVGRLADAATLAEGVARWGH